jgi:LacI family transcriptional regulator
VTNTTLKKISELLGISISTASRALKNHPDISERTKQKVIELANTLDYEPNANAIYLRTSNRKLFGLIVPRISNFFYDSFISSVEEECRKQNYSLMVLQTNDDPDIEISNVRLCRQNRVTGLFACITPATTDMTAFNKLSELEIPVVFFDKVPESENCNKVCMADADAAKLAAETLLAKKKKNILGIFGDPHFSITRKRKQAFEETLQSARKKISFTHATALNSAEAAVSVKEFLKQHRETDAIFCMSDEILTGVMKTVQQLGLRLPGDLGIISMSNGFIPKLYYPEITYVETSGAKLGKLAFARMMVCLENHRSVEEHIIESQLVEGGSL